jgi:hypothetical protein
MQMTEDLTRLQARYGKYAPAKAGEGRVVILDEQGVVLARDGWRLPLWLQDSRGDGVIYNLSLPYYRNATRPPMSTLVLDDKPVNGSELANVDNMARNSLNEELPVIVVRQALRVLAKDEVRKSAAKNGNELGNALANIFNTLTEQPDTRSWQSLPSSISMYHTDLQAGTHKLSWSGQSLDIKVAAGRTTMVWVSRQGNQLSWWSVLLGES